MKGRIIDIKRFAIHDGKGIRTTVFFKGCPLSCIWCHNPESIYGGKDIWIMNNSCIKCGKCLECPAGAVSFNSDDSICIDKNKCDFCGFCTEMCPTNSIVRIDRDVSIDDIVKEINKDRLFYSVSEGGVTLSGGEPFFQKNFTLSLLKKIKSLNISTCVETSMYTEQDTLKEAVKYTDKFYVDIKFIDDQLHKKYTGVSNRKILENFRYLALNAKNIEVRIPLIPGVTATDDNLKAIALFIKNINPKIPIELLNYNNLGHSKYQRLNMNFLCNGKKPFAKREVQRFEKLLKEITGY